MPGPGGAAPDEGWAEPGCHVSVPTELGGWIAATCARVNPDLTSADAPRWLAGDGVEHSLVVVVGDVVAKVHLARTDVASLRVRLGFAADSSLFVPPLAPEPLPGPDGSAVTLWPRVEVLAPALVPPWGEAARLLAALHRTPPTGGLPAHGGPDRLLRAAHRLAAAPDSPAVAVLRRTAQAVVEAGGRQSDPPEGVTVVHGDWHLGQLGRLDAGADGSPWRLLDIDDLGRGDPAWDLARPAGFWAAGLLDDNAWSTFLGGYRDAGGPAVPATGDPWPALDLPARAAVLVAATRAVLRPSAHSRDTVEALVAACDRMQDW